jgi:hypothetical protein
MDAPLFPLDRDTRKLFFQIGAAAANNLKGFEALLMFQALEVAEAEEAYPKVGVGLGAILMGDFSGALNYLNHPIVQSSSLAASASTFLAIAQHLQGNASGFEQAAANAKSASNGEFDEVLQDLSSAPVPDISRII